MLTTTVVRTVKPLDFIEMFGIRKSEIIANKANREYYTWACGDDGFPIYYRVSVIGLRSYLEVFE